MAGEERSSATRISSPSRLAGPATGQPAWLTIRLLPMNSWPRSVPTRSAAATNIEVEIGGFVHQLEPVIGAVGEQVLHPGPALADSVQNRLCAGAIADVGRGQVDHQQPPVGVNRDVAFAPHEFLARVITP